MILISNYSDDRLTDLAFKFTELHYGEYLAYCENIEHMPNADRLDYALFCRDEFKDYCLSRGYVLAFV